MTMYHSNDPTLRPSSFELARQAHRERSLLMRAYLQIAVRAIARSILGLARRCARLVQQLVTEFRYRSDIRTLRQFDDRALADIGLHRNQIEYAVRQGRPLSKPQRPTVSNRRDLRSRTRPVKVTVQTKPMKAVSQKSGR
jgi:uncharacterized protein YjiS (DUF1127 family)